MIYDTTSSRSSAENRNERKSRYIPLPVFPRMDDVYRQYSGVAVSFTISMVVFFVFVAFSADSLWLCDFTSNIMAAGMEEMTETNNRARISPVFIFSFTFLSIGFHTISKRSPAIKSKIKFENMTNE